MDLRAALADLGGADVEAVEAGGVTWVALGGVGPRELGWLQAHLDVHPLVMDDLTSRNQRPKVDTYPGLTLVVLYFPDDEPGATVLRAVELDLLVGPDFILSVPRTGIAGVEELFAHYRDVPAERSADFALGLEYVLYRLVDAAVTSGFPILRRIGDELERIERDLFEGQSAQIVRDISRAKMDVITFRRVIRPQRATYRQLRRALRHDAEPGGVEAYYDDLTDASERMWDVLETYRETVDGLESTNENILTHRLNDTIRVLTAVSVVLLPLTLVASIWGMNVGVPGEGEIAAFWLIVAAMAAGLLTMVWYFRRRHWL